ncbi:Ig-like domain-containing protein [Psychrobacter sp. PAMC 21119]|uniref:Ig-like domain-containing protein n=1 Tax=Psychrobacter sp. PAMC 21119 TaxID=1112209 RepID=UPI0002885C8B|nr:cadherin-like domain-containing protein [Psychrobacter sp. PAMC 21119]
MIGDGDATVNGFDLDANGEVQVTVSLPIDAAVDDTLTINGVDVTVTAAMLTDGYDTTVPAPAEGEVLTVTATVTDQAGNRSAPVSVTATVGDITAPTAPIVVIGDGDATVNGFDLDANGEVQVTVSLPIDAAVDDTLTINGVDVTVTAAMLTDGYDTTVPAPAEGEVLTVTATVTDQAGNRSAPVSVTATVGDITAPTAIDDQNVVDLQVDPTVNNDTTGLNGSVGSLLGVGALGGLVDVSLLESSSVFQVDVAAGNTQTLTVDGSGNELLSLSALLGGNNDFNLEIYRQETGSNQAELVQLQEGFLDYSPGTLGLLGSWSAVELVLQPFTGGDTGATYFVVATNPAANDGLLSLGALASIDIITTESILLDYSNPIITASIVSGDVTTNDDGVGQSIVVTNVNGDPISGATSIIGTYGTLVIDSNGAYTYTPNEDVNVIGQTDAFEYTIDDGNGNTDIATLNITITSDYTPPAAARMSATSFTLADETDDTIELPDTSLTTSSDGLDILSFEGADQVISLSDMMQPDIIDISGIGANTLNVAAKDVNSAIYVRGDSDDTVNLEGDSWSNVEQVTSDGEMFNVWQAGKDISTQIYIDTDITNII